MATLPTLLVSANSVNGPRGTWTNEDYTSIDEGIAAADGGVAQSDSPLSSPSTSSWLLQNTPSDFGSMDTLSIQVRAHRGSSSDDTCSVDARIVTETGGTVLAAAASGGTFQNVMSAARDGGSSGASNLTTGSVTAFTYVNTGATKSQWDDARVEIRVQAQSVMSADTQRVVYLDTLQVTGTYTDTSGGINHSQTLGTELVGITDSYAKTMERTLTDLIGVTEAPSSTINVVITDPVGLVDSGATELLPDANRIGITDSIVVDVQTPAQNFQQTVTDPIGLLDSQTQAATLLRSRDDTVGVLDSYLSTLTRPDHTDLIGITDLATAVQGHEQTRTDPVGITDAATTALTILVSITDPIGVTDQANQAAVLVRSRDDAVGIVDDATAQIVLSATVTDPVGLLDSQAQVSWAVRPGLRRGRDHRLVHAGRRQLRRELRPHRHHRLDRGAGQHRAVDHRSGRHHRLAGGGAVDGGVGHRPDRDHGRGDHRAGPRRRADRSDRGH
jgi:hypothetical protein